MIRALSGRLSFLYVSILESIFFITSFFIYNLAGSDYEDLLMSRFKYNWMVFAIGMWLQWFSIWVRKNGFKYILSRVSLYLLLSRQIFVLKKYPARIGRIYTSCTIFHKVSKYCVPVELGTYLKNEFNMHVVYVYIIYIICSGYLYFLSLESLFDGGDIII